MTTVAVTGEQREARTPRVRDLHEHGYRTVALDRVPEHRQGLDPKRRIW
jgi:hypothetical protein